MDRRDFVRLGALAGVSQLLGCSSLEQQLQAMGCPISWSPDIQSPVFWGMKTYTNAEIQPGGPVFVPFARVIYPSLEGSPNDAPILRSCGQYPLVLFIHGDCQTDNIYEDWTAFASVLARAGYVVVIPVLGSPSLPAPFDDTNVPPILSALQTTLDWMRNTWEFRDVLMPAPNTALIGHSYGGAMAIRLSAMVPCSGLVGLSAFINDANDAGQRLAAIPCPSMFMWGTGGSDASAVLRNFDSPIPLDLWQQVPRFKYAVVLGGAEHADYIPSTTPRCSVTQGICRSVPAVSRDFAASFLSRYMPTQLASQEYLVVPDSLVMQPTQHAPPQGLYDGDFLSGFPLLKQVDSVGDAGCWCQTYWTAASNGHQSYLFSD